MLKTAVKATVTCTNWCLGKFSCTTQVELVQDFSIFLQNAVLCCSYFSARSDSAPRVDALPMALQVHIVENALISSTQVD
jgi:hypothetical protein